MSKLIKTGDAGRQALQKGADKIADSVKITLGPKGRNAILAKKYGAPLVTNDGVTIAKDIELKDEFEKMGAELIKQAAIKTNDNAGDGTTTACVLAQAIIREGMRNVTAGANPMALKNGIQRAVDTVSAELEKMAVKVEKTDQIANVATISAQDPEVGKLIAEAMDKVGNDGVISVEEGKTAGIEVEMTEGMQFDNGYVSPYMITDPEKMQAVQDDALIFITDKKIASNADIMALKPLLESLAQGGKKQLTIIADSVEGEALTTFVYNRLQGAFNILAVKAPGFGDKRKAMLQDIAILTGGTVITEEIGLTFENVEINHLGKADKVIATKDKTTIVGGKGSKKAISERVDQIKKEIAHASSDYDREKLTERLAKLAGGVAVIRVGAATEIELKDKKLRIEDALNSTKAAVEEGIVAGGGAALLHARPALQKAVAAEKDQDVQVGMDIVLRSLSYPVRQIALNAGQDDGAILASIPAKVNMGYNAATGAVEDLLKSGVIDPKKVTRSALQNAASVAAMFLTTETMIADEPEPEKPPMPDMGAMGGMPGMM